MELSGGLELRTASERDLPQIEALLTERGDEADATDLRLVVNDPDEGFDSCAVVVDGDRVVSTATLLRETVYIGDCAVPTGQVELVATDRTYEGRGLVRALITWANERSAARGDLLQLIIGIPYFYRQFGYAYALPFNVVRKVVTPPPHDDGLTVREATPGDIDAMAILQTQAQADVDVRMPHSPGCWRWLIARDGSTQWVAERDGRVVATGRTTPPEEGIVIGELAGDEHGIAALVAHACAEGDAAVLDRLSCPGARALDPHLDRPTGVEAMSEWYYARVPDLGALLARIGPTLVDRLQEAGLTDDTHDVLISTWRSHVRFTIGPDGIGPVTTGGPEQYPMSKGGSGIAPDAVPRLLLGPEGAVGLERLLPDVWLGSQRELMDALFPPVRADLLTFYLPV